MPIGKRSNLGYSSGLPVNLGDRYYAQDLGRDLWYLLDSVGHIMQDLIMSKSKIIISGGVVSQGAGTTINITSGILYAPYNVTIPDTFAALPPSTTTSDVDMMRIVLPAQTNLSVSGATADGVTVNYVKVKYLESALHSRSKAKKPVSYDYEIAPSYLITVNSTAPTAYEICLATFTLTGGGTFTFSVALRDYSPGILPKSNLHSVSADYTVLDTDNYTDILVTTSTTNRTITLPAVKNNNGRIIRIEKVDAGNAFVIIDGAGSETINGDLTVSIDPAKYAYKTLMCTGTEWIIISKSDPMEYIGGQTYNGISLNITASNWTLIKGVLIPYQTIDGAWRLKFDIVGSVSAGSVTNILYTIAGVVFKNVGNYYQSVYCCNVAGANAFDARCNPNTGNINVYFASSVGSVYSNISGDVELNSKPNWVA